MKLKLLTVPDCWLRQKSAPVTVVDKHIRELAQFMLDQLDVLEAVGMAAPQYGEMVRLIVVKLDDYQSFVMINPEIVRKSDQTCLMEEGCKSIPGKFYLVKRPKRVKVRGLDMIGRIRTIKAQEFLARVLCHEIDHLDGVMIDQIGTLIDE